jgi:hypothetical protein
MLSVDSDVRTCSQHPANAAVSSAGPPPVGVAAEQSLAGEDSDLVVHPARAQRVLDQVQAWAEPGDDITQVGVPLNLLHGDRTPVGHEPGQDGLVVDEAFPDP